MRSSQKPNQAHRPRRIRLVLPAPPSWILENPQSTFDGELRELAVLPHALNRGLWTDLLKLSTLRSHCSLGITLPDRPLRRLRPDTQNLTRKWTDFIAVSHILTGVCPPEALQKSAPQAQRSSAGELQHEMIPEALWAYQAPDYCTILGLRT